MLRGALGMHVRAILLATWLLAAATGAAAQQVPARNSLSPRSALGELRASNLSSLPPAAATYRQPPDSESVSARQIVRQAQSAAPQPQDTAPPAQDAPRAAPATPLIVPHRFWDRTNDLWFAGVGASRAFDYASTLNLRQRGLNEIFLTNAIVDNHPLFAGIEAAATAASIGVSYIFHRTGHHQLERWTSAIHFGLATGGAVRNYALKTQH